MSDKCILNVYLWNLLPFLAHKRLYRRQAQTTVICSHCIDIIAFVGVLSRETICKYAHIACLWLPWTFLPSWDHFVQSSFSLFSPFPSDHNCRHLRSTSLFCLPYHVWLPTLCKNNHRYIPKSCSVKRSFSVYRFCFKSSSQTTASVNNSTMGNRKTL